MIIIWSIAYLVTLACLSIATNLPSHIKGETTFYRAVTGGERTVVTKNYPVGGHPATPRAVVGDFSHDGAVYVFHDLDQAIKWGNSFSRILPDPKWYLVTFKYYPITGLKTKSFTSGTTEWKEFVTANYNSGGSRTRYDIVEGPVSIGRAGSTLAPYKENDKMVYEAGFMRNGLKTLTVVSVTPKSARGAGEWCSRCNVM